ncbi:hypothetical protein EGR_07665 [Echinococcus granulosus]|uniref:Uncharacterized protein n=1 Tax=Echinococcus granulosus TaxID=6210 RepID=W6U921_ECHGR|nr:hypothetical protein EGR_07665 [Echinococcus granulosus]EUB57500.1 hypothetical protein EGR_07665 [Echinococcus granulosus]
MVQKSNYSPGTFEISNKSTLAGYQDSSPLKDKGILSACSYSKRLESSSKGDTNTTIILFQENSQFPIFGFHVEDLNGHAVLFHFGVCNPHFKSQLFLRRDCLHVFLKKTGEEETIQNTQSIKATT